MADSSTTAGQSPICFAGGSWSRSQLRNGLRYVPVLSKPRILLSSLEGVLSSILAEVYSRADLSTTTSRIEILVPGGCCGRRQLRKGIGYILVASKPTISMTSVEGVLGSILAEFYPIAAYLTTA